MRINPNDSPRSHCYALYQPLPKTYLIVVAYICPVLNMKNVLGGVVDKKNATRLVPEKVPL
jgi:hypothetical protein